MVVCSRGTSPHRRIMTLNVQCSHRNYSYWWERPKIRAAVSHNRMVPVSLVGLQIPNGEPDAESNDSFGGSNNARYSASQSLNIVDERPGDELGHYNPFVDGSGTGRCTV
jgi:hypothetical protein